MKADGMTVGTMQRELIRRLTSRYGAREARAMTSLIFFHLKGWDNTAIILNSDLPVSQRMIDDCGRILARLDHDEPIQYILGQARFYGMDLKVSPAVLIPRPETAELVDMIVQRFSGRDDLRILDIGTGSGAIAIALSRNLPFSRVTAVDISEDALDLARQNAADRHADIRFMHLDILTQSIADRSFDIIVSNPPYIPEEEKRDMEDNVLRYEPASALFVPDNDPLKFYRRIADVAVKALVPGGSLYFEINPRFAADITAMLHKDGFLKVAVTRDAQNRDRFVSATLPDD